MTLQETFKDQLLAADSQFRHGNFEDAVILYAGVLSEAEKVEENNESGTGTLVLKVAECHYAAGNFLLAKEAYEKLLVLQENSNDFPSKDKVFTLVKAAKNYEKCDDLVNAQTRYEQAYRLAAAELPQKHFLRRTVIECYAQWLRVQKSDSVLLSILESELGVILQPAKPETAVQLDESSKPDAPTRGDQRKDEQDFAKMKDKLANRKPASEANPKDAPKMPKRNARSRSQNK